MSARSNAAIVEWIRAHPVIGGLLLIIFGLVLYREAAVAGQRLEEVRQAPAVNSTIQAIEQESVRKGGVRYAAQVTWVDDQGHRQNCRPQIPKGQLDRLAVGRRVDVKRDGGSCVLASEADGGLLFHLGRTPLSPMVLFALLAVLTGGTLVVFRDRLAT